MPRSVSDEKFPCKLYVLFSNRRMLRWKICYQTRAFRFIADFDRVIDVPFPDERLANIALRTLSVDKELSPLVDRTFDIVEPAEHQSKGDVAVSSKSTLQVIYRATTNRMLRVSVNGFFESLRLVVQVMEDLDVDVCMNEGSEELTKVQGLNEVAAGV
jgi:EKC/KEOPS complex subunit PCC1/LAGE3